MALFSLLLFLFPQLLLESLESVDSTQETLPIGMKETSESVNHSLVSDSVNPGTTACQAPLSMEFSRQEYWNG